MSLSLLGYVDRYERKNNNSYGAETNLLHCRVLDRHLASIKRFSSWKIVSQNIQLFSFFLSLLLLFKHWSVFCLSQLCKSWTSFVCTNYPYLNEHLKICFNMVGHFIISVQINSCQNILILNVLIDLTYFFSFDKYDKLVHFPKNLELHSKINFCHFFY